MDTLALLRLTGLALLACPGLAFAHSLEQPALGRPAMQFLSWSFEPWVIFCLLLSLACYGIGLLRLWRKAGNSRRALLHQGLFFLLGWLMLVAALVSPLDALGSALFSAHMLQHELMMIAAAPLLVLSRPFGLWMWALPESWRGAVLRAVQWPGIALPWRFLTNALVAWMIHAVALWVWHVPAFFSAALADQGVHTWQHLSFLVSALFFWWTVMRDGATRSGCGTALLALFTTMLHTSALGALLTFAATPWYAAYLMTAPALGWEPLMDQQLGGLIMWVPAGLVYVAAGLALGAKWLQPEKFHSSPVMRNLVAAEDELIQSIRKSV